MDKERLKHVTELTRQGYSDSEILDRMEIYDNKVKEEKLSIQNESNRRSMNKNMYPK